MNITLKLFSIKIKFHNNCLHIPFVINLSRNSSIASMHISLELMRKKIPSPLNKNISFHPFHRIDFCGLVFLLRRWKTRSEFIKMRKKISSSMAYITQLNIAHKTDTFGREKGGRREVNTMKINVKLLGMILLCAIGNTWISTSARTNGTMKAKIQTGPNTSIHSVRCVPF